MQYVIVPVYANTNTNTNNLFSNQQSIQLTTLYNIVSVKKKFTVATLTGGRTNSHGCFHGCAQGTVASGECESGIKAILRVTARMQGGSLRGVGGDRHTHTQFFLEKIF